MLYDPAFHEKVRLLLHRWRLWIARKDYNRDREILSAFLNMEIPDAGPEGPRKVGLKIEFAAIRLGGR